ncbi:hypothetical protein VdG1_05912 [Verticillium dahliae VDG1]|nr:hypothetical protein VdG1_05912 [Verticillium dahliae VDG1]
MKNGPADGSSPAQGPPYDPTTGFPSTGVLPVVPPDLLPDKNPRSNAATAASAAGVRALSAQAIAFYFRAPVKAFFRTRVDYLAWARSVHLDQIQQQLQRRDPASAAARSRAVFFSTFEYVKAQSYYRFVTWYYGDLNEDMANLLATRRPTRAGPRADDNDGITPLIIKPHYAIEPLFLLLAGVTASFAQQACEAAAAAQGRSVRSWLYRGFWWNTIRQVPSTSAGLIIFELVRRKYGLRSDEVRINKDGYDIQLN